MMCLLCRLDNNCYSNNHKMFFESVIETKCLESFLGKPSKVSGAVIFAAFQVAVIFCLQQLNSSQLSRIQGFTVHLLRLVCEEKIILGTVPEKLLELK